VKERLVICNQEDTGAEKLKLNLGLCAAFATVTSLCRFGDKLRWDNTAMNLETHSLY